MSANRDRSRSRSPIIAMTCRDSDRQSPWQLDAALIASLPRTPKCAKKLQNIATRITTELCLFQSKYTHSDALQTAFETVAGGSKFAQNQPSLDFKISILEIGTLLKTAAKSSYLELEIQRLEKLFGSEHSAKKRQKIVKAVESLKRARVDLEDAAKLCDEYTKERENCTKESQSASSAPTPKLSFRTLISIILAVGAVAADSGSISHQYAGPYTGPALAIASSATVALPGLANLIFSRPDEEHQKWQIKLAQAIVPQKHMMQISRSQTSDSSSS